MTHNYYQQPQLYQPQNIYQQLGTQQPQPHQPRQGGPQIQQRLALAQAQGQPPTQSLVQQRVQAFQQPPQIIHSRQQQQVAHPGLHLPIQQQPPVVQHQLVQYQARPVSQYSTSQYPYPISQTHAMPIQDPQSTPWHNPHQAQYVTPLVGSMTVQPSAPSTQAQRRPLPQPIKRSEPLPQPRTASTSPTRSRPLPAPTPRLSKVNTNPTPNQNGKPRQEIVTSTPSRLSNSAKVSIPPVAEPPKRGRASPPRFSVVPLSSANLATSGNSSPSPPSSVSSLSPDSLSGSPVIPARSAKALNDITTSLATARETRNITAINNSSPSFTLSKLKSELASSGTGDTRAKVPNQKFVPVWKRTLPDVLPPLLPTPPPNPSQQRSLFQPQPVKSSPQHQRAPQQTPQQQSQLPPRSGPHPPIPSHSKSKLNETYVTLSSTKQSQPHKGPIRNNVEPESDEEDEDEDGTEEEEESYDHLDEPEHRSVTAQPSSPQYGIRDLPSRPSTFSAPALPHPPTATGHAGHASTSRASSNGAGFVSQPIQASTTSSKLHAEDSGSNSSTRSPSSSAWETKSREDGGQSMTMRLAASAMPNNGLPQPPSLGGGNGSPKKYTFDLDDTPPPRSAFVMQRGLIGEQAQLKAQGRRALPTPGKKEHPTVQQLPRSQIYAPSSTSGQTQPTVRPQSQIYHMPLKDGARDNGELKTQVQRARSFGRGRQLPQPQVPRQQESRSVAQRPLKRDQQPRSDPLPQPVQPMASSVPRIDISIESPAPVGGRDKRADFGRLESEGEAVLSSPVHSPQPVPMINIQPEFMEEDERQNEKRKQAPEINVEGVPQINVPQINVEGIPDINVVQEEARGPKVKVYEIPGISVSGPGNGPEINASELQSQPFTGHGQRSTQVRDLPVKRGGLTCGGCGNGILGRIVSAMGQRWHPECFRCTVCDELLEHVSSYEWEGRAYCHLDYHENFAPKCYSCKTPIYEERFISLDDPALGKRAYHEQHFFCSECGDPFLAPSSNGQSSRTGELTVSGDGDFASDDVGFTVYRGYPYCEACHVRLRLPKCKRCKRSIRDHDQAVEALGGKWCWACFTCKGCERPFDNPSFFERSGDPYCEPCFTLILRNEL